MPTGDPSRGGGSISLTGKFLTTDRLVAPPRKGWLSDRVNARARPFIWAGLKWWLSTSSTRHFPHSLSRRGISFPLTVRKRKRFFSHPLRTLLLSSLLYQIYLCRERTFNLFLQTAKLNWSTQRSFAHQKLIIFHILIPKYIRGVKLTSISPLSVLELILDNYRFHVFAQFIPIIIFRHYKINK